MPLLAAVLRFGVGVFVVDFDVVLAAADAGLSSAGRGGENVGPAGRPDDPGFGSAWAAVASDATDRSVAAVKSDAALLGDRRNRWCITRKTLQAGSGPPAALQYRRWPMLGSAFRA